MLILTDKTKFYLIKIMLYPYSERKLSYILSSLWILPSVGGRIYKQRPANWNGAFVTGKIKSNWKKVCRENKRENWEVEILGERDL